MSESIHVLQVMATLDRGGAESVVVDWLRELGHTGLKFGFVVNDDQEAYELEEAAVALGAEIIRAPRFRLFNILSYSVWWWRFLGANPKWEIVHAHHTVPAFAYLFIARLRGRMTIAHSHNTRFFGGFGGVVRTLLLQPLRYIPTLKAGCSQAANRWMFGSRSNAVVIRNGIQVEKYQFSPEYRDQVRRELGLDGRMVVGHVGRFHEQKNHHRVLRVFREVLRVDPSARLLLVGDGEMRAEIEDDIARLRLTEAVVMVGVRGDVERLMSGMDAFVLPSLFEGLPVVLVEAQASGLPCLISDAITSEVCLTSLVQMLSLDESDEVWADAIRAGASSVRHSHHEEVNEAGYGAEHVASEVRRMYEGLVLRTRKRGKHGAAAKSFEGI